ncbi:PREDICTED: protein IQ-DOMAIN 31-like [Tarenaya hassleriana]|uniref:protein IQ-DOMAIN 31-like n=1 Tax=Tarenaya hassleriana TaxID=28532 RepID=UPI00053C55E2|nr:PREDICTED: protein IQ-DOMAIN 31-like [Tarenaya hassleriana]XP_010527877.1 PREDICTED: protein IQ-DOMAIN 31-like [Tarenaya hassleriana]XP_010527878.1 PREDICTED: protein IQ-DOMAIN 31-like [Tarenaya hassleriana]XP_010527879.1 PREDICTED: protein IQ-DOMAIN 31-like [Tarenaya hassleriana]
MGKTLSPGKWLRTFLGKKSSKSSLAKGNVKPKSAKKEEVVVVSVKDDATNLLVEPPVVSSPFQTTTAQTVEKPDTEQQPSDGINVSSVKDNEGDDSNIDLSSQIDSGGELKRENAATKIQAAFRAHQARKDFGTCKGIVKLQAVIRGHLVRRQAVATYVCIRGIVKLQALIRGGKARSSDNGIQLQKRLTETKSSENFQARSCSLMENPAKLSIIDKLMASSPTALPLKLQYGPEDPNSAKVWLERWTRLQIWAPSSRSAKTPIPKPPRTVDAEKGKQKRGIKKPSGASTENSSGRSTAENGKPRRNVRIASTLNKEIPRMENDKVKQNSRKTISSTKDENPRPSVKKVSNTPLSSGSEKVTHKSAEKKEKKKKEETTDSVQRELDEAPASLSDVPGGATMEKKNNFPDAVSRDSDLNNDEKSTVLEKPEQDELKAVESSGQAEDVQGASVQLCSENGDAASENTKPSDRRASLPAKIENQDEGLTRKLPSYMAPTESAKARVRRQGTPRFAQERIEKNGIVPVRRHSLPSPRAHRLLLASVKGSMNSDGSFSSSKDVGDNSIRAEWKR